MKPIYRKEAQRDLAGIGRFIARRNPARARSFVKELKVRCEKIPDTPLGYRTRPELIEGLRSVPHGSYLIFYTVISESVQIVRILHAAQDLPDTLDKE
ncbi:MAG: type II toxin-antitoxin system RelE/ParE family toxin [Pseudoxanthomonas sp.]